MLAVVYHTIHVQTPYKYNAQLFIKDVPKDETKSGIKSLLEEAGYKFGEFGILWANHDVEIGYNNFERQVKGAYRNGDIKTIYYKDINKSYDENGEEI